jgi:prepilin-type N-terminal cleavage/methylation domain-containing protein
MKIKRYRVQRIKYAGFTLIELLVVIGILGILAAALLAAINPIEQLNKSQDAGLQSESEEFANAAISYYSAHNAYPWDSVANGGQNCYSGGSTISEIPLSQMPSCIQNMVSEGDLKSSFSSVSNLSQLFVDSDNLQFTGSIAVCFMPQSTTQQQDASTRFTKTDSLGNDCKSQGGTGSCYWCTNGGTTTNEPAPTQTVSVTSTISNTQTSPSVSQPSPTLTPTPTIVQSHEYIISTLYAYPTLSSWQQVEASTPTVNDAIVNICAPDGSGSGCNGNPADAKSTVWPSTISALKSAGITPLYYISSNYGATAETTIESEIQNAITWYAVPSPMFDEMQPGGTCTNGGSPIPCTQYYHDLYTYSVNAGATVVMFNPGSTYNVTTADMYGQDEVLQVFEGTSQSFETASFPSWMTSYPAHEFSATLSVGTSAVVGIDIQDAVGDNIGNFYEDDEAEPPDYATLPSFWSTEVNDVKNAN